MSRKTSPLLFIDANNRSIQASAEWLAFRGVYSGTNLTYAARARPGSAEGEEVWQIMKLTYDGAGNILKVEWPEINGKATNAFSFSYTDYLTYTYS